MIQAVRGVRDILPEESGRWAMVEQMARQVFASYGYGEIRTPMFESVELFARAVGATTDIVEKEMYVFTDRNGDALALRPEGTASVVRAFIEHGLQQSLPWKIFYMGPMFRHERPQKGRFRQFHQIGCELFGAEGPLAEVEMLTMLMRLFNRLGLGERVTLEINSLGCPVCRPPFRDQLVAFLQQCTDQLCGLCLTRMERNPLRVLDCKRPECRHAVTTAPALVDHLCPDCATHFQTVRDHLSGVGVPFTVNPLMVRGLDYYTRTAFELTTTHLGAQNAVAAGGRYDNLVAEMGGTATPAIGFALGLERLVLLLDELSPHVPARPECYIIPLDGCDADGILLAEQLRDAGWQAGMSLQAGSLKTRLKRADRSGARLVLMLGERERTEQVVLVRDMTSGAQHTLSRAGVVQELRALFP
jgi:histidyl-tRNA synthetase